MLISSIIVAFAVAQAPVAKPPVVQQHAVRSRRHRAGESAEKRIDDLTLDLVAYGEYVIMLEKRVADLERHACRRREHVHRDKPRPTVAPKASAPACGWREFDSGVWLYGYQDGDVFRYSHYLYRQPMAPAGCAGGSCGR